MRVAWDDYLAIRFGKVEQRCLDVSDGRVEIVDRAAQPESKVSGNLIVPAASGVQSATEIAGQLNQT